MRDTYLSIAYGIIVTTLTAMLAWAWYADYANTPVHYTTIQTVDEGGYEHDCLVATYRKDMSLDCIHPND
jgi:hypothetical protein